MVKSFDFRDGKWVVCPVEISHSAEYSGEFLTLYFENGTTLEVTADHPIWVIEGNELSARPQLKFRDAYEDSGLSIPGRWVHSQKLRVGDQLCGFTGTLLRIKEIRSLADRLQVYNLSVLGNPYYAVGPFGILVHNTETVEELLEQGFQIKRIGGLERPPLADGTKSLIKAAAPKNAAGQYLDKKGNVIKEPTFGHKTGFENRRIIAAADRLGLNQDQLKKFVDAHPDYFFIEEKKVNLSHVNELPGTTTYLEDILADMKTFFHLP